MLYDIPSFYVSAGLFLLMVVAMLIGTKTGKRLQVNENDESRGQANAVQGSLLGLLALLLGFTFSLSLGRYDERATEVVNEANAIGTAWLRTDLVAEPQRAEAKRLLREYGRLRVEAASVSAVDTDRRRNLIAEAEHVFDDLWNLATAEARAAPSPVTFGLIASLNDMIDALSNRDAAVERHVPELVLMLLFGTFILLGGIIGFASAISNVRPGVPVYAMLGLIVILVFLILDLDRPRRGLIEVDQTKLVATVRSMNRGNE